MKHLRHLTLAVAATALCTATALACGTDKTTAAAASTGNAKASACCAAGAKGAKTSATAASHGGMCTPEMMANCTPEMKAACAAMKGGKAKSANASGCTYAGAAMAGMTTASFTGASHGKGVSATAAGASCSAHGKATMAAGSGCSAHGSATMAAHDCDACSDMAMCEGELSAAGARAQIVPLKNGVMYVYTAESPERVRQVQQAVARGNERARSVLAAGEKARLCPECKRMRGAMASGKLQREVVNVETGALTLVTSNDKVLIGRIHDIAGAPVAARTAH